MASIHVRDVPEETLTTLRVRAARAGQSLQAYVLGMLIGEADTLSMDEFADEARSIASRGNVTEEDILAAITETRDARAA